MLGFLFQSGSASACALNQVLLPDGICCVDSCGDCHATTGEGAEEGHAHHANDGGTCLCKAKGAASLTHHAGAAMAALHVQSILFISIDAWPLNAFAPSALPAKSPPPDVGRGLPLLF